MTVTTEPVTTRIRRRTRGGEGGSVTPESARVAELRAMLADPAQSAHHGDILAAIEYLTAATAPAA